MSEEKAVTGQVQRLVIYKKSVLHDFLEGEGMTLLIGNDGHYYTVQDRSALYGDTGERPDFKKLEGEG
mgnify:CR=1 FL=1|tara:strand:+ start:3229 stop:3432 length:204 start_codon:yes stop_codon:yes gene_type:complete